MSSAVKTCGLSRPEDIAVANELRPDCVGFVFWPKSRRYVTPEAATGLRALLSPDIPAVGVFVDEDTAVVADLLQQGTIQVAQLHGHEDETYIAALRQTTSAPIWKAFKVRTPEDVATADASSADLILLDNGYGTGETFDWSLVQSVHRPYLLAGGLTPENVSEAVKTLQPFGVDVSSGIETDGHKDPEKMRKFLDTVRNL